MVNKQNVANPHSQNISQPKFEKIITFLYIIYLMVGNGDYIEMIKFKEGILKFSIYESCNFVITLFLTLFNIFINVMTNLNKEIFY
jgi:hypothetical protein